MEQRIPSYSKILNEQLGILTSITNFRENSQCLEHDFELLLLDYSQTILVVFLFPLTVAIITDVIFQ